jgi:hypothetical protein
MLKLIDRIPLPLLAVLAVFFTLAPLKPQPHLIEKLGMLMDGTLARPIDIFDLFLHATPLVLLVIRLIRLKRAP